MINFGPIKHFIAVSIVISIDENLKTHFVDHFIRVMFTTMYVACNFHDFLSVFKLAQGKSLPRVDFQVACDNIKSSIIISLGAKPLMQWYTVRFPTQAMKSLTSARNEEVCLTLKTSPNSKAFWHIIIISNRCIGSIIYDLQRSLIWNPFCFLFR